MNSLLNNVYDLDSEMDVKLLELELENYPAGAVSKRIKRELKELKENCSSMSINYSEGKPLLNITVMDRIYEKNNVYSFIIDVDYPFKPPKVEINFVNYSAFLKTPYCFSEMLYKIHGMYCLCCSTITCHADWSPACTINHIILEIRNYKKYKRNVVYKLFADKIKNKYLIDDVDLDSWLF